MYQKFLYQDIYCSQEHEACHCGNLPPFHRNDLQGHMRQDCNLNTRSPVSLISRNNRNEK
jgi:hypothetical protein